MIPGILRLSSKIKYGMTSRNVPIYLFNPLNKEYGPCIVGCSAKERTNVLALISVEKWESEKLTRGNLVKILGKCGDLIAEEDALLYQYSSFAWKPTQQERIVEPSFDEHPLVHGYTFNVDPDGCRDIDDAITFGEDGYMYIVIADVAAWYSNNKTIFENAQKIGQTMYKNGEIVCSLLPPNLQLECSLLPGQRRRGLALKFKWQENRIQDISFQKISVVNSKTFTYDSIYTSSYKLVLKDIASHIANKEVCDSHEWIEQLMIFYNCEVAKLLISKQRGILRAQRKPNAERLEAYTKIGADLEFLANKSAFYAPAHTKETHWCMSKEYCHATSPIRRFADIVNQMVIRNDWNVFEPDIEMLNKRSAYTKKYERDILFVHAILKSSQRCVEAIVLSDRRVWVPEWKKLVTCTNTCSPGTSGSLHYSLDMNQPTWKSRMVFRFEDTNCQE